MKQQIQPFYRKSIPPSNHMRMIINPPQKIFHKRTEVLENRIYLPLPHLHQGEDKFRQTRI